jgi:hypothetical protein
MLKEILAVSGKPGLYRLISKGNNLLIIESLADKKRIPAHTRDKVISLADVLVYTDGDEASVSDILTSIKVKEEGGKVSLDLTKAQPEELRTYFAEILPNFDRERVYPTDIKKILKWYEILLADGITDFSKKEDKEEDKEVDAKEEEATSEDAGKVAKAAGASSKTAKATTAKRKGSSIASTKATATTTKSKPTAKTMTPKKSVVGAKRGS